MYAYTHPAISYLLENQFGGVRLTNAHNEMITILVNTGILGLLTFLGIFMLGGSIILGIMALYDKLTGVAPEGFTTVLIIQLFMGSIIMISLGIIGYYISKIYEETKRRPRYIVTEICKEK